MPLKRPQRGLGIRHVISDAGQFGGDGEPQSGAPFLGRRLEGVEKLVAPRKRSTAEGFVSG